MTEAGPHATPYPRFSDAEMRRRREALAVAMAERGVEHALVYGADRSGSAIAWLTRWSVTREALVVFTPGEPDVLLVNFHNHVPNAERIATEAEVRWAGNGPIESAIAELERRGARGARVGLIGPLRHRAYLALGDFAGELVALDGAYTRLRLTKSDEELEWLRLGCELTDAAVRAIHEGAAPGVDERELGDLAERA